MVKRPKLSRQSGVGFRLARDSFGAAARVASGASLKRKTKMKLIFLFGMPGVGKLTVAREVAELSGFRLFHNHLTVDLVGSLFEFGSQPFVELRETVWLASFAQAVEAGIDGLIFTFAFDRTARESFVGKVR